MDKKEEKTLENKSKMQKSAEETLPGRQLGLYSKVDKKEVRNMVSEINTAYRQSHYTAPASMAAIPFVFFQAH